MDRNLYDKSFLEKCILKTPYYVIGIDTYDNYALTYCLMRKINGVIELLISKTMRDRVEFEKEIKNLSSYFNADILR